MAAMAAAAVHEGDAGGLQIYAVDDYDFKSSRNKTVCFSTLPLRLGEAAAAVPIPEGNNRLLFLRGFAGRRRCVLKRVVAWRLELDGEQPEFFVLLRADGGGWLRLAKPARFYERRTARTVLMTAQLLHFLRRNPDGPETETALWNHLRQAFDMFWPRPSEHDFRNQTSLSLMRQFAATDPVLANSEALRAIVERISTEVGGADNDIVDEYVFEVSKDNCKLVCFSTLPLQFRDAAIHVPEGNKALYLLGHTNRGLMLQKKVVAWTLELDSEQPQFWVLAPADNGGWLRLAKASKFYKRTARTVLITAQMLHFLRRNPDGPETALWTHLGQVFGNFRTRPSVDDLWNQTSLSLMRQFAATDPVLANSEALRAFVERISTLVGGADIVGIADEYSFIAKDNYELVCFSTLPLRFSAAAANVPEGNKALYLKGFTAGGIRLRKEVVAWRLELDGEQPRFLVLAPGYRGGWLCLANAILMYKHTAKTVLMTAQMLHFLRRNPDGPRTALWIHLHQVFGKFWSMPSEDDFRNQTSLSLMRQFTSMDPVLANSEVLQAFVDRISTQVGADSIDIADGEVINEKIGDGNNESDEGYENIGEDGNNESDEDYENIGEDGNNESDEDDETIGEDGNDGSDEDLFDSICAICDDGGEILCCDGPCMRSFHAREESGEDSYCDTLGYTKAEVEAMELFLCKNCEYKQHQCFICGVLEPSDGATAKVFLCNNATCGHFYHPKCVAQQLQPNNINEASELEKKIAEGFVFTCPIHQCFHCKGLEDREEWPLQFAVCRRCPKSYHRKCLPRQISFEEIEEAGIIRRAWELSKGVLIYCMDHEIDHDTKAPVRDHIKFPKVEKNNV